MRGRNSCVTPHERKVHFMLTNKRSTGRGSKGTRSTNRIAIRGSGGSKSKPPMAKASKIPPGKYRSTITSIKAVTTAAGDDAVEVVYGLVDADGRELQMREVIPTDSWSFERFCDALIAAGFEEDDDLFDAVGITEDVELVYPDPKGLGHFGQRTPADKGATTKATPKAKESHRKARSSEDDDEFDDLLDDLDNEDE